MDEEYLEELFSSLPDVRIRRMFGGQGIYSEGRIVAIVIAGELYLKSDPVSEPDFRSADCRRWTYERADRKPTLMPYFRLPDDALDDQEEMRRWADLAFGAALRSQKKTKKSRQA